jgi:hypothetical protein
MFELGSGLGRGFNSTNKLGNMVTGALRPAAPLLSTGHNSRSSLGDCSLIN